MDELTRLVQQAESLGYHSVWIPEAWGRDSFTVLGALAAQTSTIRLATGIVNIFSRSPTLIAQSAASLDDISGGRAILGLGASGPAVIQRWHGMPFRDVLQRTREYVDVIRMTLSGERVNYDGQIVRLHDFALAFDPPRPDIPIYLAAIGPATIRLAGEIADGWLPIFVAPDAFRRMYGSLLEGERKAGRKRTAVTTAAYIPSLIGPGEDHLLRAHIAYYMGGMGSFYADLLTRSGWARQADRMQQEWKRGDRRAAGQAVTDDMLESLTISGSAEEARSRLAAFRKVGIDLPILAIPHGSPLDMVARTIEALAGT